MNLLKMAYCKVVHVIKYNLIKAYNFHLNCLIRIFHELQGKIIFWVHYLHSE
jgi:hypothetical protein